MPSALPDVVRYHLPWAAKACSQQPEGEKSGWEAWWGQQGTGAGGGGDRPREAYRKCQGTGMVCTVGRSWAVAAGRERSGKSSEMVKIHTPRTSV